MIAFADPPPPVESTQPVIKAGRSIEELTQTVSASRLSTWLQCRLKFHLRYVAGVPKPPTAALHVGKTVHAVLQQWNLARWRNAPLDGDAITAVFEQAWSAQSEEAAAWKGEEEADSKVNALAVIQTYLRETPIPLDEKPEGVEVSVEMDLTSHGLPTLVGVLDLVRAGGRIVDFKTTGRTPDPKMVRHTTEVQTTGYALLYREATGKRESGIELHHLVKLKTPKLVVTEAGPATDLQINRLFHLIDAYVDDLERRDPVPAPGLQCASCEFFNECRLYC
jgi:CRISPR/Cas system-associated exonuclease Cas4 (RecB family)